MAFRLPDDVFSRRTAVVVLSSLIAFGFMLQDAQAIEPRCAPPADHVFIDAALDYYLDVRQPSGGSTFSGDGTVIDQLYQPYGSRQEFLSVNPDCCKVFGLTDSDGMMYSRFQIAWHDLYTTVEVRALRRIVTDDGLALAEPRTDWLPMNSCAEVVPNLVGG